MEITAKDIDHLAMLSDFSLSDSEKATLTTDLQGSVHYISKLDERETENVEPTYQVFEMENVWREDKIIPQEADREALLELAPEKAQDQIKVPKVL